MSAMNSSRVATAALASAARRSFSAAMRRWASSMLSMERALNHTVRPTSTRIPTTINAVPSASS